jgi:hypothetical protein
MASVNRRRIATLSTRFLRYMREQVFLEIEEEYKGEIGEKVEDAAGAMKKKTEQNEGEADPGGKKEILAVDTEAVDRIKHRLRVSAAVYGREDYSQAFTNVEVEELGKLMEEFSKEIKEEHEMLSTYREEIIEGTQR